MTVSLEMIDGRTEQEKGGAADASKQGEEKKLYPRQSLPGQWTRWKANKHKQVYM